MIHIGETYGKSPAQIGLRWLVQKGISAIPKSVNPERIAENADIFDFELTDMEMKTIDALMRNSEVQGYRRICRDS